MIYYHVCFIGALIADEEPRSQKLQSCKNYFLSLEELQHQMYTEYQLDFPTQIDKKGQSEYITKKTYDYKVVARWLNSITIYMGYPSCILRSYWLEGGAEGLKGTQI